MPSACHSWEVDTGGLNRAVQNCLARLGCGSAAVRRPSSREEKPGVGPAVCSSSHSLRLLSSTDSGAQQKFLGAPGTYLGGAREHLRACVHYIGRQAAQLHTTSDRHFWFVALQAFEADAEASAVWGQPVLISRL